MAKPIILLADNDQDFLETRREFLESEGLHVKSASSVAEAKSILAEGRVDLAVIDLRLDNNDDKRDMSGLNLAQQVAPSIPKIIVSQFTNPEVVRNALLPQLDGFAPAVDFIDKGAGLEPLLTAIRRALARSDSHLLQVSDRMALRIDWDYKEAQQQARWYSRFSLGFAVAGFIMILIAVYLAMTSSLAVGILTTVVGLITQAISALFFSRADAANKRMDHYHKELLQIRQLELLLAACEELPTGQTQENSQLAVIQAAMTNWFGGPPRLTNANTPTVRE